MINLEYFEKSGRSMVRIDNADLVEANMDIGSSYIKMCIASFFAEFVDRLTKEKERNDRLFHLLSQSLNRVKFVEFTRSDILYYQLQTLDHLGFMPNFKTCVQCGRHLEGCELDISRPSGVGRSARPVPGLSRTGRTLKGSSPGWPIGGLHSQEIRASLSGTEEKSWKLSSLSI